MRRFLRAGAVELLSSCQRKEILKTVYKNWRGITLLSIVAKIRGKILLTELKVEWIADLGRNKQVTDKEGGQQRRSLF